MGVDVHWIWEMTGWSSTEDCKVLLDGETLKRLRIVVNPAPEGRPPEDEIRSRDRVKVSD